MNFFQSKKAQKNTPGWRIFWARASQSMLTKAQEKASESAQGHAGHLSPGGGFFHLLSLCRFLGSSLYSIKYDIFMKCQSRRQWTGKNLGKKASKKWKESAVGNGIFPGISVIIVSCSLGWWSVIKSNNIKLESYLCLIFMRWDCQWWAFDCPAHLRFSLLRLRFAKNTNMATETSYGLGRDFRMSFVRHKFEFN